jgi:glyoxalase family protein
MTPSLLGLHHVTAIASDPQQNVDFYTGVLGLRLVKVTVNVDDPEAYHLYYGDELGRPGTLLTFYCWPGAIRGRPGTSQVIVTALAVPPNTLDAWRSRLSAHGVVVEGPSSRGAGQVLAFRDPDGLALELMAHPAVVRWPAPLDGPIPAMQAIRGLYGITIWVQRRTPTEAFLTAALGARRLEEDAVGGLRRYRLGRGGPGTLVDVREMQGVGPDSRSRAACASTSRRTSPASASTKTRRSWAHTWHCLRGLSTGGRISRIPYRRYIGGTRHDVKACRDHAPDLPDH